MDSKFIAYGRHSWEFRWGENRTPGVMYPFTDDEKIHNRARDNYHWRKNFF